MLASFSITDEKLISHILAGKWWSQLQPSLLKSRIHVFPTIQPNCHLMCPKQGSYCLEWKNHWSEGQPTSCLFVKTKQNQKNLCKMLNFVPVLRSMLLKVSELLFCLF